MSKGRNKKSESSIVIDDEWSIRPDSHQWQLCKKVENKGKILWQPKKYGTLKYLVKACFDLKIRESSFSNLKELSDNVEEFKVELEEVLKSNGLNL